MPGSSWARGAAVHGLMIFVTVCGGLAVISIAVRDAMDPVPRWTRLVRTGTVEERREAAAALSTLEGRDILGALAALAGAVADRDERVATSALAAVALASRVGLQSGDRASSREAIAILVAAMKDPRPEVRTWAAMGIFVSDVGRFGDEAPTAWIDALIVALGDPSDGVRIAAVKALGEIGRGGPGIEALERVLDQDASTLVRREAARILGRTPTDVDRATIVLLQALGKDEGPVREACDSALFSMHADPGRRRSAAIAPRLAESLKDRDPRARTHAAAILGEIGPAAESSVAALVSMLDEPYSPETWKPSVGDPIRWQPAPQAALALGLIAPEAPSATQAAQALVALIRDGEDEDARAAAAEALARFDPVLTLPAVPVLLEVLRATMGDPPPMPPAPSICFALGRIAPGSPLAVDAIEALAGALHSENPDTRLRAAEALAAFGAHARPVLPRLRALASQSGEDYRLEEAVEAAVRRIDDASSAGPKG